jgi:hypothetical protein
LLDGKVDLSELVISKTVKNEYANPNQIAHRVLADRMGERDPGNKPQSNDRIPYCYIDISNLKCKVCLGKINEDNCKCINCMNIYCVHHLKNHRDVCNIVCRFCKIGMNESESELKNCGTCHAWYCPKCYDKHNLRTDKYKEVHNDKCKKPLNNKLLQGDMIEHPLYIKENKLKVNYKYYLEHQIEKPVYQIFELVMNNPEKIIEDLLRKMNNLRNGNHSIKDWLKVLGKNETSKLNSEEDSAKNIININLNVDEEENLLEDLFEEDAMEDIEQIVDDIPEKDFD